MKTSLILLSKNRKDALQVFVSTIRQFCHDVEIIVVDDASTDSTRSWLLRQGDIISVLNDHSIPVDEAWNLGGEIAKGEFIWFLNEDHELTGDPIPTMIKTMEHLETVGKRPGSLAQKVFLSDGSIQSRGHAWSGLYQIPVPGSDILKQVDWAPFPFVRKSVWKEVGGFPVYGQIYYGDTGFGLRLQKAGYTNWYEPKAELIHHTIGLFKGNEEDKKRRKHNETVHQAESRERFMAEWEEFLKNKVDLF